MKNIKKYVHWKVVFNTLFFMGLLGVFNPVAAQRPQPLSSLERSISPNMMMLSNSSRYASYKYFSEWLDLYSDSLNILNPFWLGSILPNQNVNIAAAGNNLIFSQGGIFSWVADTSSAPQYTYRFNINPKIGGGQAILRSQNVSTGFYNGLFINSLSTTVFADNNLILSNPQVQNGLPTVTGNYTGVFDESGAISYLRRQYVLNNGFFGASRKAGSVPDSTAWGVYARYLYGNNAFNGQAANGFVHSNRTAAQTQNWWTSYNVEDFFNVYSHGSTGGSKIALFSALGNPQTATNMTIGGRTGSILGQVKVTTGNSFIPGYSNAWTQVGILDSANADRAFGSFFIGIRTYLNPGNTFDDFFQRGIILRPDETIDINFYPPTRNDAGTPVNMLSTSDGANGTIASNPLSEIFAALSAQNTSDQTLTTGVNNAIRFQNVSFTSGGSNITITNDTLITINQTGVYELSFDGRFDASASTENTSVQFVATNVSDMGANFAFSILTTESVIPMKRIFQVTAVPATIRVIQEATTWASGSVLCAATSSLNIKRLY